MSKLSFIVYSKNPETSAQVSEQLIGTGRVVLSDTFTELPPLSRALESGQIDGIYLDLDVDLDDVFDFLPSLPEPRPLMLLGAEKGDSQLLLRAMRLGARDFYVGHQLIGVEGVLQEMTPVSAATGHAAPVVAVVGVRGGVGGTSIACELGVAFQEAGLRTVVCDLSRSLGTVALYFDLKPRFDIIDIVKHEGELDLVFVDAVLGEHQSEVSVLAASSTFEDVNMLTSTALERVLTFVKAEFDCVILDVPWGFDEIGFRALDMSNEIIFVTTPDVVSLTHARTCRRTIEQLGARPESVHLVLNRASADASISEKQAVDFLECDLEASIPELPESARKYTDAGIILRDVQGGDKMRNAIAELRNSVSEWCQLELLGVETSGAGLMTRFRKLIRTK